MLVITFLNISNLADVSDYEYTVRIGGDVNWKFIETGYIRGHRRSQGWEALVKKLLKEREVTNE